MIICICCQQTDMHVQIFHANNSLEQHPLPNCWKEAIISSTIKILVINLYPRAFSHQITARVIMNRFLTIQFHMRAFYEEIWLRSRYRRCPLWRERIHFSSARTSNSCEVWPWLKIRRRTRSDRASLRIIGSARRTAGDCQSTQQEIVASEMSASCSEGG